MKYAILLVENCESDRKRWGSLLQEVGYVVHLAGTRQEAWDVLESSKINLAIIDMRLEDEESALDISGLELATDTALRHIPKIILTAHSISSYENQRKVWKPVGGEPPAVVAIVGKEEGPQVLLKEIRHALDTWPHLSLLASKVSDQIKADHSTIRLQAKDNYMLSLFFSIIGFAIIVVGLVLASISKIEIGIVGSSTGLILEALGYLFFKQMENANRRMDLYHQELLQTYGVEFLLSITSRLPSEQESICIKRMIYSVLASWYPRGNGLSFQPSGSHADDTAGSRH
jgi:CheY-like chemotaxis protein